MDWLKVYLSSSLLMNTTVLPATKESNTRLHTRLFLLGGQFFSLSNCSIWIFFVLLLSEIEAVSTACYVLNRVSITNLHNKTPYELLSGKVPNIRHLKPFGRQVTILNTSDHLGKFEGKANEGFLVGYAANSYTRFKTIPPAGTQDTNIIAGTQDDDSESEYDEQAILVPSFPSNSFLGPKVNAISAPIENNLDYAEELARLQKQEHEAHSTATKYGFQFSNGTTEMLHQAKIETRRNLVLIAGDPAGSIVSTGGVPVGSVPAGSVPASHVPTSSVPAGSVPVSHVPASSIHAGGVLAGSIDSAGFGDPAASESAPAVFTHDHAATSVYVDDIIFGSTNQAWCNEFEVLIKGEFEMSAMGELTFFLGLQVKQLLDGIFISQDKYIKDMLKKFDMESVRTATTPYEVPKPKSK
nr:copia protein [Tanacetum cinerariifolium]